MYIMYETMVVKKNRNLIADKRNLNFLNIFLSKREIFCYDKIDYTSRLLNTLRFVCVYDSIEIIYIGMF